VSPTAGCEPQYNLVQLVLACLQVVNALVYLHSQGLLHCDVKPVNMLLDADKVADFGLGAFLCDLGHVRKAGAVDPDVPSRKFVTGCMVGSSRYTAPETLKKEAYCRKAEVFAMSASMFEITHGDPLPADDPWCVLGCLCLAGWCM
jgi:serine/threonine protein kinase